MPKKKIEEMKEKIKEKADEIADERIAKINEKREEKGRRPLTIEKEEEIREKTYKQLNRKVKRRAALYGIIGALGLTSIIGGVQLLPEAQEIKENPIKTEETQETGKTKRQVFAEQLQTEVKPLEIINSNETQTIDREEEINNIKNTDEAKAYLKNIYIEPYEEITGDTSLTTENITIVGAYEESVRIDNNNGDLIINGDYPAITSQNIEENNISWSSVDNKLVYKVRKDGKVIDCMVLLQTNENGKGEFSRAIPGDEYNEMKDYQSIMASVSGLDEVIRQGVEFCADIYDEDRKEAFIEAVEEFDKMQIEKNAEKLKQEQNSTSNKEFELYE